MKHITKLSLLALFTSLSLSGFSQLCGTSYYITSNAGWTNSEYYQIIDIDAAKLTDADLPKFTSSDGSKNALEPVPNTADGPTDFASGYFKTPVMTSTDGLVYTPTSVLWPVMYKMAAFAPTMWTSAFSKDTLIGSGISGTGTAAACTLNNNTVMKSAIYKKPGFIELSRLPFATSNPTVSRHGYIEIDSIPQVERIQWSYSSTSWKRGVKCDINYNDGNGWIPQRWVASAYNWEAVFSEQGYQFEEVIGKQDDPSSFVSFRIRIWDGDSIHYKVNANDLSLQATTYTAKNTPLAAQQTVRVHQIKVFSNVIPTKAPIVAVPTAVASVNANSIKIYLSEKNIVLSETAKVELYSIDGKTVFKGYTNKIDAAGFNRGIYIIRAVDNDGKIQNKKIAI
ncbi:MAG: T9SS type A sorting domain-containing protein [Paludibacter sp.]